VSHDTEGQTYLLPVFCPLGNIYKDFFGEKEQVYVRDQYMQHAKSNIYCLALALHTLEQWLLKMGITVHLAGCFCFHKGTDHRGHLQFPILRSGVEPENGHV
jgi:hypothetical protein